MVSIPDGDSDVSFVHFRFLHLITELKIHNRYTMTSTVLIEGTVLPNTAQQRSAKNVFIFSLRYCFEKNN